MGDVIWMTMQIGRLPEWFFGGLTRYVLSSERAYLIPESNQSWYADTVNRMMDAMMEAFTTDAYLLPVQNAAIVLLETRRSERLSTFVLPFGKWREICHLQMPT